MAVYRSSVFWALFALSSCSLPLDPLVLELIEPLTQALEDSVDSLDVSNPSLVNFPHEHFALSTILTHLALYPSSLDAGLLAPFGPQGAYLLLYGLYKLQAQLDELEPWRYMIRASTLRLLPTVQWLLRAQFAELTGIQSHLGTFDFLQSLSRPEYVSLFQPATLEQAARYVGVLATATHSLQLLDLGEKGDGMRLYLVRAFEQVSRLELQVTLKEVQSILSPFVRLSEMQNVVWELEQLKGEPAIVEYKDLWLSLIAVREQIEPVKFLTDAILLGLLDWVKVNAVGTAQSLRERQKVLVFAEVVRAKFEPRYVDQMVTVFGQLAEVFEQIAQQMKKAVDKVVNLDSSSVELDISNRLLGRISLSRLQALAPKDTLFWRVFVSRVVAISDVLVKAAGAQGDGGEVSEEGVLILRRTFTNLAELESVLGEAPLATSKEVIEAMGVLEKFAEKAVNKADPKLIVESIHRALATKAAAAQVAPDHLAVGATSMIFAARRYFPEPRAVTDVVVDALKRRYAMAVFDCLKLMPHASQPDSVTDGVWLLELVDRVEAKLQGDSCSLSQAEVENLTNAAEMMRWYLTAADVPASRLGPKEASVSLGHWLEAKRLTQLELGPTSERLKARPALASHAAFWLDFRAKFDAVFAAGEVFLSRRAAAVSEVAMSLSQMAQLMLKLRDLIKTLGLCEAVDRTISEALTPLIEGLSGAVLVETIAPDLLPSEAEVKKALVLKNLLFGP